MTKILIKYRPFSHITLTYTVESYEVVDGLFLKFFDVKDNVSYLYPLVKCEIVEVL